MFPFVIKIILKPNYIPCSHGSFGELLHFFLWLKLSYPALVCLIYKRSEVFHSAISVWILKQHTAHILSTEVHLMRQL